MLAISSITGSLVTFATHAIGKLGVAGVGLLMLSTGVIFVPGTEPTLLFAGFNVYNHTLPLVGVLVAALIGDVLGATIAYAIGYFGKEGWVQRRAGRLHRHKIDRAQRWFARYGEPAIFISRMLPVVRSAFPYAAGVAQMPFRRFVIFATLGSIPWIVGLTLLGREVGQGWQSWRHHLEYADYVGAALVVAAILYLIIRRFRSGRSEESTKELDQTADVLAE
ncbi:MAG: DedA family protein [Solirubrobacterales bacterium]|nr:DedA family protein [Solirubrobacterales bacterium]